VSERTNRQGVEVLAEYLRLEETPFRHLIFVEMPSKRSYMHLDTVFTLIDRGTCLAYLPVIAPGGPESARVYYVDLYARELTFAVRPSLLKALSDLGVDLDVVPCGGSQEVIDQQREQWTDGANAFAVAPGVVILYRRNRKTIEELGRRGWRILPEEEVVAGQHDLLDGRPAVVTLLGNELSRARGGPRCMTMPLEREGV
jgi:arginine deiminase